MFGKEGQATEGSGGDEGHDRDRWMSAAEKSWIIPLEHCGRYDAPLVGDKAANLGEMRKLGIPVPGGFAVTSEAARRFFEIAGVEGRVDQLLGELIGGSAAADEFRETGDHIRRAIESAEMPKEFRLAIARAYKVLCNDYDLKDIGVAVRSSVAAEERMVEDTSLFCDSYLNVAGIEDLLDKIRKCWAGAFVPWRILCRFRSNLPILSRSLAVAVQKMVRARASGVAFTVSPATGNYERIVLEGNWGVAERALKGMVEPDRFEIDKGTLTVRKTEVHRKKRQMVLAGRGILERDVPEDRQEVPCIEEDEAESLARWAEMVEEHYGHPMNIEWAVDSDLEFPQNIFLVEARLLRQFPS